MRVAGGFPGRRVRAAAVVALVGIGMLLSPTPGLAQVRVGSTFVVSTGASPECGRGSDVALDTVNNVYLVVWGGCEPVLGRHFVVQGRFVALDGTLLGTAPFVIPATTTVFTQAPRVAFSPQAGVFLVIWYDNRDNQNIPQVYGRTLSYQASGVPSFPGADFNISQVGTSIGVDFTMDPGIGYSSGSQTFLVAYSTQYNITARRVSTAGSVGSEIAVTTGGSSSAGSVAPDIAYNAFADEFFVAWKYFADPAEVGVRGRRVTAATGALPDATWLGIDSSSDDYGPPVPVFDPVNNRYLVGWFRGSSGVFTTFGRFVTASGALSGSRFTIASEGTHFSLGLARSALTGTYLAAFAHSTILEIYGTEVTAAGVGGVLTALTVTSAWQNSGIDYARAAASGTQAQWLVSAALPFAIPSRAVGQRVASGFGKSSPATGAANLPSTVTLTWGAVTGAGFEVCVDATNDNACGAGWVWNSTATSTTLAGLAVGTYYWQVRSVTSVTTEADGGTWWSFTVSPASALFSKTAPTTGATVGTNPAFVWTTAPGATSYSVCINTVPDTCVGSPFMGTWTSVGLVTSWQPGLAFVIGTTYYWQVRTIIGSPIGADNSVWFPFMRVASPPFTDPTLTAGATVVKAVHITELRQAIATLRTRYGLSPVSWTDSTLTSGLTTVKAVHVMELRTALNAVYAAAGSPLPTYTDPTLTAGATTIKAVHISELRTAVVAVW
jgi:hypothetical protein